MNRNNFFYFGKIYKTFGLKGQLLIKADADDLKLYKNVAHFFLMIDGGLVPFLVMELTIRQDSVLVLLEGMNADRAVKFTGIEVYLPDSDMPKREDVKYYFHEIVGYTIEDTKLGIIGIVKGVLEHTHQEVLEIDHNGIEILLPLVDEFIEDIDKKKKILYVNAPEGLLDLYLNR
jgi:16S rRNA processing protein RimM